MALKPAMRTAKHLSCSLLASAIQLFFAVTAQALTLDLSPAKAEAGYITYVRAKPGETLLDIARRYDLGYLEIKRANPGVDPWILKEGERIRIPAKFRIPNAPREGIVVDLRALRLFYFPPGVKDAGGKFFTFPVSIGRVDWPTPVGTFKVVAKVKDPVWFPPLSIRLEHAKEGKSLPPAVEAGGNNPLGKYALKLSIPGYLIHGTNKPFGIGMRTTHGCIRMYPEDMEQLYKLVPIGTPVHILGGYEYAEN